MSSLVESKEGKDNNASRSSQVNSSSRFLKPKTSGSSASGGLGAASGPSAPSTKKASVAAADAFVKPEDLVESERKKSIMGQPKKRSVMVRS